MSAGSPGTEHPTGWNSSGNDLLRERCKTLSYHEGSLQYGTEAEARQRGR